MEKLDISLIEKSTLIYDLLLEVVVCYISNYIMCRHIEIEYFYSFEEVFCSVNVSKILDMLQLQIVKTWSSL
jgi:hypothetical protein